MKKREPAYFRLGKRRLRLPRHPVLRIALGLSLVMFGLPPLNFLPILGLWMAPAGLLILSHDLPWLRRFRRRADVWTIGWWRGRRSDDATGTPGLCGGCGRDLAAIRSLRCEHCRADLRGVGVVLP